MARAPLSIVIPTLNAEAGLPGCLAGLTEGLSEGLIRELIVSDGGSRDATPRIAEQAGAEGITGPASRGGQLRRGVAAAQGDWLLILHADSQLPPGWTEAALHHMATAPDKAGYFRLGFRATGLAPRLVAGWANLRSQLFGLPYGDQGLLIPRGLYDQIGGYRDIALMEDVTMARSLRGRLCALPLTLTTSAIRYQREGWLRRGGRNLGTLGRFLLGTPPEKLVHRYHRKAND